MAGETMQTGQVGRPMTGETHDAKEFDNSRSPMSPDVIRTAPASSLAISAGSISDGSSSSQAVAATPAKRSEAKRNEQKERRRSSKVSNKLDLEDTG